MAGLLFVALGQAGEIEGKFFPATSPFLVEKVTTFDMLNDVQDVYFSFNKNEDPFPLLPEGTVCDFEQITFKKDSGKTVGYSFLGPRHGTREGGRHEIGVRLYNISVEELYKTSSMVKHKCAYRPYLTKTKTSFKIKSEELNE